MCELSKLLTIQNPKKLSLKNLGREVKHGIPYAMLKLNYISHHSEYIFLTTSIELFCKVEGCFTLHLARFRGN